MQNTYAIVKEGGKVKAAALRAHLDTLPNGSYFITVEEVKNKKSIPQNSYLHVLFTLAAKMMNKEGMGDGTQWTKDKVKTHCKQEGLYPIEDAVLPGGEVVQVWKDTRDLSKEEAMETIDRVIRYFAELGLVLPEPNEQLKLAA